MPLKCPACGTPIRHQLIANRDATPLPGRIYRCAVCRLDLILKGDGTKMILAPLHKEDATTDKP